MTLPTESAASCPRCFRAWHFVSDAPFGIGKIRAVHPPGPCRPVVYEWEPEPRTFRRTDRAECRGCGVTFTQKRVSQLYCEPMCRRRYFNRLRVVERCCASCGGEFRTVYRKQITCSEPCRRRYRKEYHAAQWINRRVREYQRQTKRRAA